MAHDSNENILINQVIALAGDAVDRLDSLLLEIRHIQMVLVREIKEPDLYSPLQFEEDYLWGAYVAKPCIEEAAQQENTQERLQADENPKQSKGQWRSILSDISVEELADLVNCWVIKLNPDSIADYIPDDESGEESQLASLFKRKPDTLSEGRQPAKDRLASLFKQYSNLAGYREAASKIDFLYATRNISRGWGPNTTRLYYSYAAGQALKSNILKDKLLLSYWMQNALRVKVGNKRNGRWSTATVQSLGRFLVARSGVMYRMRQYIDLIASLRAPLERELDISLKENPPPMVMRRQGQGLYNEFLAERATSIHHALNDFLVKLEDIDEPDDHFPYVHHGWVHGAVSRNAYYKDEAVVSSAEGRRSSYSQSYVKTSFWMIDRPDLQPIISHEVAHYFIDNVFGNVGDTELKFTTGHMGVLLRSVSKLFRFYNDLSPSNETFPYENLEVVRELSADLLASVRNPTAYLWATYLELVGLDLYEALETPDTDCDLMMIEQAEKYGFDFHFDKQLSDSNHLWAVRLNALCAWVESIDHRHKGSKLRDDLIQGVRLVNDVLLQYLEDFQALRDSEPLNTRQKKVEYLRNISKLADDVVKAHATTQRVYAYNKERSQPKALQKAYPSERPIPRPLLSGLIDSLMILKANRYDRDQKASGSNKCDPVKLKKEFEDELGKGFWASFGYLADFPWFVFQMRVRDVSFSPPRIKRLKSNSQAAEQSLEGSLPKPRIRQRDDETANFVPRDALHEILTEFKPGYDLWSQTLEMHLWSNTSVARRLDRLIRLVGDMLSELSISAEVLKLEKTSIENVEVFKKVWTRTHPLSNAEQKTVEEQNGDLFEKTWELLATEFVPKLNIWLENLVWKKFSDTETPDGWPVANSYKDLAKLYKSTVTTDQKEIESLVTQASGENDRKLVKKEGFVHQTDRKREIENSKEIQNLWEILLKVSGSDSEAWPGHQKGLKARRAAEANPLLSSVYSLLTYCSVCSSFLLNQENEKLRQLITDDIVVGFKSARDSDTKKIFDEPMSLLRGTVSGNRTSESSIDSTVAWTYKATCLEGDDDDKPMMITALGRQDFIGFCAKKYAQHLPVLAQQSGGKEKPTLSRLEAAMPFKLSDHSQGTKDGPSAASDQRSAGKAVCIMFITLTGRDSRLDFVLRLKQILSDAQAKPKSRPLQVMERLFKDGAYSVFLTEGWSDVGIAFFEPFDAVNTAGRLEDLYSFQAIVFQDFLVENVETIYTSRALEYLQFSERHSLTIQLRLKSDRNLSSTVRKVDQHLNSLRLLDEVEESKPVWVRTAGRLDYKLDLNIDQTRCLVSKVCSKLPMDGREQYLPHIIACLCGMEDYTVIQTMFENEKTEGAKVPLNYDENFDPLFAQLIDESLITIGFKPLLN